MKPPGVPGSLKRRGQLNHSVDPRLHDGPQRLWFLRVTGTGHISTFRALSFSRAANRSPKHPEHGTHRPATPNFTTIGPPAIPNQKDPNRHRRRRPFARVSRGVCGARNRTSTSGGSLKRFSPMEPLSTCCARSRPRRIWARGCGSARGRGAPPRPWVLNRGKGQIQDYVQTNEEGFLKILQS